MLRSYARLQIYAQDEYDRLDLIITRWPSRPGVVSFVKGSWIAVDKGNSEPAIYLKMQIYKIDKFIGITQKVQIFLS